MKIKVKLFAYLTKYQPNMENNGVVELEVEETCKIKDIITILNLPANLIRIILINGKIVGKADDHLLKDNDILSLFPPITGG